MRANRKNYATGAVRAWLRGHNKIRIAATAVQHGRVNSC